MAEKDRVFKGYLARDLPQTLWFKGKPKNEAEHFALTVSEAETMNERIAGIPIVVEHNENVRVGTVIGGEVVKGSKGTADWTVDFRLDTSSSEAARDQAAMVDLGYAESLSLHHDRIGPQPVEVTICQFPARNGATIYQGKLEGIDQKKKEFYNQVFANSQQRVKGSASASSSTPEQYIGSRFVIANKLKMSAAPTENVAASAPSASPAGAAPGMGAASAAGSGAPGAGGSGGASGSGAGAGLTPIFGLAPPMPSATEQIEMQLARQGVRMFGAPPPVVSASSPPSAPGSSPATSTPGVVTLTPLPLSSSASPNAQGGVPGAGPHPGATGSEMSAGLSTTGSVAGQPPTPADPGAAPGAQPPSAFGDRDSADAKLFSAVGAISANPLAPMHERVALIDAAKGAAENATRLKAERDDAVNLAAEYKKRENALAVQLEQMTTVQNAWRRNEAAGLAPPGHTDALRAEIAAGSLEMAKQYAYSSGGGGGGMPVAASAPAAAVDPVTAKLASYRQFLWSGSGSGAAAIAPPTSHPYIPPTFDHAGFRMAPAAGGAASTSVAASFPFAPGTVSSSPRHGVGGGVSGGVGRFGGGGGVGYAAAPPSGFLGLGGVGSEFVGFGPVAYGAAAGGFYGGGPAPSFAAPAGFGSGASSSYSPSTGGGPFGGGAGAEAAVLASAPSPHVRMSAAAAPVPESRFHVDSGTRVRASADGVPLMPGEGECGPGGIWRGRRVTSRTIKSDTTPVPLSGRYVMAFAPGGVGGSYFHSRELECMSGKASFPAEGVDYSAMNGWNAGRGNTRDRSRVIASAAGLMGMVDAPPAHYFPREIDRMVIDLLSHGTGDVGSNAAPFIPTKAWRGRQHTRTDAYV